MGGWIVSKDGGVLGAKQVVVGALLSSRSLSCRHRQFGVIKCIIWYEYHRRGATCDYTVEGFDSPTKFSIPFSGERAETRVIYSVSSTIRNAGILSVLAIDAVDAVSTERAKSTRQVGSYTVPYSVVRTEANLDRAVE